MNAMSAGLKRDSKGRFLPLGNTPQEEIVVLSPKQNSTKKKVAWGLGLAALVYLAVKAVQMLDIKENIRVAPEGLRSAKLLGKFPFYTGFSFTLDVKLQNITKSSMSITYPFVVMEVRRAATKTEAADKAEISSSVVKKGTVEIKAQADTALSFDFAISFASLGLAAKLIDKPMELFVAIYKEIVTPTGKDGKTNFKPILEGTGLSFWSITHFYAASAYKTAVESQIF